MRVPVRVAVRRLLTAALLIPMLAASGGLSGCQWRPPAATVNDTEISVDQLQDDLETLQANPEIAGAFFQSSAGLLSSVSEDGAKVPAVLTADVLGAIILERLFEAAYARSDKRVSEESFAARKVELRQELDAFLGSPDVVEAAPDDYIERVLAREVRVRTLLEGVEDPAERQALVLAALGRGEVSVDPRFGVWDTTQFQVVTNDAVGVGPGVPAS